MAEWVACAECNTRYDSGSLAFCPHCGSTATAVGKAAGGPTAGIPAPLRRDPRRMRLQLGGVLILLVGGLYLVGAVAAILDPGPSEAQLYMWGATQNDGQTEGGTVSVHVVGADGNGIQGANVTFQAGNRTVAQGLTDAEGAYASALHGSVAVQVNVTYEAQTWSRQVLAPSGSEVQVPINVGTDDKESARVLGATNLALTVIIATLVLSLLLALGGLAAAWTRWRGLALAGPLPVVILSLLLVALLPGAGTIIILAMVGVPYALVLSGRSAFRR